MSVAGFLFLKFSVKIVIQVDLLDLKLIQNPQNSNLKNLKSAI